MLTAAAVCRKPFRDPAGGADEVLVSREAESIAWTVAVPQAGTYSIRVEYYPLEGRGADFERTLLIDGALPREEAERMLLPRVWGDEKETVLDSRGNEIRRGRTRKAYVAHRRPDRPARLCAGAADL